VKYRFVNEHRREHTVQLMCHVHKVSPSGFYEWGDAARGRRQPYFIRASEAPLLAFAGLWERWRTADGQTLETCVIVTTDANAALAAIHDRMPLLVGRAEQAVWLDARRGVAEVAALLARSPALTVRPVTTAVNDPLNDEETLLDPAPDA